MPELPEVEITRRGIAPAITGRRATGVIVRNPSLRWPVPKRLAALVTGNTVQEVKRRGKYLLLQMAGGWLILHLGMSGSLRIVQAAEPAGVHDHVDLQFGRQSIRLRDPRRFGAVLWHAGSDVQTHPLLVHLGVEPLGVGFSGSVLHAAAQGRRTPVKVLLMDHRVVVGVGNIYANESLFRAGIRPGTRAGRVSLARYDRLAAEVRTTLLEALHSGGSSLRDFVHSDGSSGYFQQQYFVYGREGEPCRVCKRPVRLARMGQRSTFYCPHCQH
ncbi:MAG: bifunctional DNA-formamidopyrimidine glycosylase/DNA-(apurinic or apyrimidinic site) lyase [Betaproteobacteria bacterium]|nr:bifunctional DNA-formamidopyrimidine glycosylase/DNA-(apurinic or apyrimidinic site) lyase [Betaproteobacteria bacterium]